MPWDPCMQQSCSLELPMPQRFNLLFLLKDLFHIERELLGCIQLYHLHLLRSYLLTFSSFLHLFLHKPWISIEVADVLFLMQVAIEFPYVFAQTLIYSVIFYSLASFEWTALKFTWYIFFMYFTLLYFTFFGMMTTAVTPNHNVAAIIAAPFYMLWNLFSGFMIPHKVMNCHFLVL